MDDKRKQESYHVTVGCVDMGKVTRLDSRSPDGSIHEHERDTAHDGQCEGAYKRESDSALYVPSW